MEKREGDGGGGDGKEALEQKLDEAVTEGIPKSGTQEGKWRGRS